MEQPSTGHYAQWGDWEEFGIGKMACTWHSPQHNGFCGFTQWACEFWIMDGSSRPKKELLCASSTCLLTFFFLTKSACAIFLTLSWYQAAINVSFLYLSFTIPTLFSSPICQTLPASTWWWSGFGTSLTAVSAFSHQEDGTNTPPPSRGTNVKLYKSHQFQNQALTCEVFRICLFIPGREKTRSDLPTDSSSLWTEMR